jgi:glycogen operon protein
LKAGGELLDALARLSSRFWRDDVRWYGVGETPGMSFHSHSLAFCLHGASQNDNDVYVMINTFWQALAFEVQEGQPGDWFRVLDTSLPSPQDIFATGLEPPLGNLHYKVGPRSTVVLIRKQVP